MKRFGRIAVLGKLVTGSFGPHGAPSQRKLIAGVSGAVFFIAVNVWALTAIGLFDGHHSSPKAIPVVDDTPSPSAAVTPTAATSSAPPSTPTLVKKTTALPMLPQTKPRATRTASPTERSEPTPTMPTTTEPVQPKPTPARTLTPEEMYTAYCLQQGWDPDWCDPSNRRTPQRGNHR